MSDFHSLKYLIKPVCCKIGSDVAVLLEIRTQGEALNQLHDQVRAFAGNGTEIMNRDNVGMVQLSRSARLTLKHAHGHSITKHSSDKNLDGHFAIEAQVCSL